MRSPTSCEGASLVMFGIRLETLPMEASISVSPNAFVAVRGGLGARACRPLRAVATIPSVAGLESVPDLAAGGGPDSPEHPASATRRTTTTAIRDSAPHGAHLFRRRRRGRRGRGIWGRLGGVAEGAEGAGVDGAGAAGAPTGAGSRTTEDARSPPRSARVKDVSVKSSATPVVILPEQRRRAHGAEHGLAAGAAEGRADVGALARPAAGRCR